MKNLTILPFILILLSLSAAAETEIFAGKVITDTNTVIDGKNFKFIYEESTNKVFVQADGTNMIVENGACSSRDILKVCIKSAAFYGKNITTYEYYYTLDVTVSRLTGSLSVNSSISQSKLLQKESADLIITITNPTDYEISNIEFSEDLSPFYLAQLDGCEINGNRIEWKGSLKPKYDKTCATKIVAQSEGNYNFAGNVSYFNSYENEKKTTDSLQVQVLPPQLKPSYFIDDYIEASQPFYFNMSIQNLNSVEAIDGTMTINLPKNIILAKDVKGFTKEFNQLTSRFVLDPATALNYSFYLQPLAGNKDPIKETFNYKIKNINDVIENTTQADVIEPVLTANLSADYQEIAPGQKFIVSVDLKNPSRIYDFTDIKANLHAPYNGRIQQSLDKLLAGSAYSIISSTLLLPKDIDLSSANTFKINLTINYKLNDVQKSSNQSLEIKIKPKPNPNPAEAANAARPEIPSAPNTKGNEQKPAINNTKPASGNNTGKSNFFASKLNSNLSKKFLMAFMGVLAVIVLAVIIYKARKRWKGKASSANLQEKSLEEQLTKPK